MGKGNDVRTNEKIDGVSVYVSYNFLTLQARTMYAAIRGKNLDKIYNKSDIIDY